MNVLFLIISPREKKFWKIPLGVCYLSSSLKKYGHYTKLFLIEHNFNSDKLDKIVHDFQPGIILMSALTNEMPFCENITAYLNNKYNLPIFLGGVHATLLPEESLQIKGISGICVGEGEYSVVQLVSLLEKNETIEKIPGIWIKKGIQIIKNPPRKLEDINKQPFPDRGLLAEHDINKNQIAILASRGCPHSCTMCSNSSLRIIYKNKKNYFRVRNVKNIISEAKLIKKLYSPKVILFANDTFPLHDLNWLKQFFNQYKSKVGLPFKCKLNIKEIREDKIKSLKEAGCIQIKVGIESGNNKMLCLINKDISPKDIIKACKIIKSQEIKLFCYYILGLPYETEKSLQDTIKLHKEIGPDVITASTFIPLPKTPLLRVCIKEKFINSWKPLTFGSKPVLNLPSITQEELRLYKKYFTNLSKKLYKAKSKNPKTNLKYSLQY